MILTRRDKAGSPIELQRQLAKMGNIRLGAEKPERGAGKKLEYFRFTSPSKTALQKLAAIYGGEVTFWQSRKQWQLYSKASEICVLVDADMSVVEDYSLFDGKIQTRKCDGETCVFAKVTRQNDKPSVADPVNVPCMCEASGNLDCKLATIIKVMIPATEDVTLWWVKTTGTIANQEINALMDAIRANAKAAGEPAQAYCKLTLAWEENSTGTNKWVVPRFSLDPDPPNFPAMLMAKSPSAQARALQAPQRASLPSGGQTDAPTLQTRQEGQGASENNDPRKDKVLTILRDKGWTAPEYKDMMDSIKSICQARGVAFLDMVLSAESSGKLTEKIFSLEQFASELPEHGEEEAEVVEGELL